MNKYGWFSILMALLSVIALFALRGPNANGYLIIAIFSFLSGSGITLAILSKKFLAVTLGVILNGGVLAYTYLLLIAFGISEP